MRDLGNGVSQLDLGKANVYLINGPDGLTLVDTAVRGSLPRVQRALAEMGRSLSDLRRIVVTHAHVDHVGGLAELQGATGAAVWAHRLDAPYVRRGEHPPYPPMSELSLMDRLLGGMIDRGVGREQPPAPVARELTDGEWLGEALPGAQVVHLPGHTPGHIGLWWPEQGLLLGGDVAMHLTPWLTAPLAAYTTDMGRGRASIRRAARLRPRTLGVGHGPALVGNATGALEGLVARLAHVDRRQIA